MRNSPLCVDSLIFWVDFVIERICVTNIPWLGGAHLVCSQLEDYFIIKINTRVEEFKRMGAEAGTIW